MKRTKIRHNFEYQEFILWVALPKELRVPKTQAELSKHFGVGQDTLSEWKKQTGFWEKVSQQRKEWGKEKTSDIIYALYKRVLETGGAPEVKLWFQITEEWSERLITVSEKQDPLKNLTDAELALLIKKQTNRLRKKD